MIQIKVLDDSVVFVQSQIRCQASVIYFPNQKLPFTTEMAKRVANILRAVLSLQQGEAAAVNIPLADLAPHITRLPMPEDYTLDELRGLTQSYLRQLIVSQ